MQKAIGIVLLIVSLFSLIGFGIAHYYISYQYEKAIGSYMENAKDMNTPDKMLEQLGLAKEGMAKEGLTEDLYGAWIFKKPDNSMEFQYKHLDSIIVRVEAVQQWLAKTYGNETNIQTETLGDVYEQKMTNLRMFIMEDTRSDWIAKKAWYVNKHFFFYLPIYFVYLFFVILTTVSLAIILSDYI